VRTVDIDVEVLVILCDRDAQAVGVAEVVTGDDDEVLVGHWEGVPAIQRSVLTWGNVDVPLHLVHGACDVLCNVFAAVRSEHDLALHFYDFPLIEPFCNHPVEFI